MTLQSATGLAMRSSSLKPPAYRALRAARLLPSFPPVRSAETASRQGCAGCEAVARVPPAGPSVSGARSSPAPQASPQLSRRPISDPIDLPDHGRSYKKKAPAANANDRASLLCRSQAQGELDQHPPLRDLGIGRE